MESVTEVEGDIRSTGLPEGSNPSIPIILFRRVMVVLINRYTAEFELISKRELKYFNDFDSAYEVLGEL